MGALLKCNGHQVLDLDGILSENRFLQESLEQIREEKQLSNEIGRKYKLALEQATQRKRMGSNSHSQDLRSPTRGNKYARMKYALELYVYITVYFRKICSFLIIIVTAV